MSDQCHSSASIPVADENRPGIPFV